MDKIGYWLQIPCDPLLKRHNGNITLLVMPAWDAGCQSVSSKNKASQRGIDNVICQLYWFVFLPNEIILVNIFKVFRNKYCIYRK